jgi:hypothetical protein
VLNTQLLTSPPVTERLPELQHQALRHCLGPQCLGQLMRLVDVAAEQTDSHDDAVRPQFDS